MKNSFGEEYGKNKYELYPRPAFTIIDYGNVYNPKEKVEMTGSISLSLYQDIADLDGLDKAKDAWWELYEWIMTERKRQRNKR
jgi:hypothetical protein